MKRLVVLGVMLVAIILAGCADRCGVCGKYVDPTNQDEYIELNENGTYKANLIGQSLGDRGEYNLKGGLVNLSSGEDQLTMELRDDTLVLTDGLLQIDRFVKEGTNKTVELTPSETVNAFIELYFEQGQVEKAQKYVYSGDRDKITSPPPQRVEWKILSEKINNNGTAQVEARLKLIEDTETGSGVRESQVVTIDLIKEVGEWKVTAHWEGETESSQGSEVSKEINESEDKPIPLVELYDIDHSSTENGTRLVMNLTGPPYDLTVELRKDNYSAVKNIDSQEMSDGHQRIQFNITAKEEKEEVMSYDVFVRSENRTLLHRTIEFKV